MDTPARLQHMASGHLCLLLAEEVRWESFPAWAGRVTTVLGATVKARIETADMRLWTLKQGGVGLRLVYEDYPCQISLESDSIAGDELLRQRAHDLQALQEAS